MSDTSRRSVVRVLVDSALQLLQELVNVEEVALGSKVGQWQRVGVVHGRVLSLSNHGASVAVLAHTSLVAAGAENWKLNTLEAHEALTNIVVGRGVNCTTLGIAKELVESVVSSALPDFVVVVELLRLIYSIVNGSIGRVLGWASIEASRSATGMLLAVACIGAKGTIGILISTRCSGKRLQVSDHCCSLLDIERRWMEKGISRVGSAAKH